MPPSLQRSKVAPPESQLRPCREKLVPSLHLHQRRQRSLTNPFPEPWGPGCTRCTRPSREDAGYSCVPRFRSRSERRPLTKECCQIGETSARPPCRMTSHAKTQHAAATSIRYEDTTCCEFDSLTQCQRETAHEGNKTWALSWYQ